MFLSRIPVLSRCLLKGCSSWPILCMCWILFGSNKTSWYNTMGWRYRKLNLVEKSNVGSNDLIYQTVSYISANFKKKFSLEEMAKDLGVSKYVLSRLFSKTFHRNFNQYLNDVRLNYACQRLENTSDSITKICLDSGFESQRTFNRVFKERYKISPSDYRSTCLKDMLS